MGLLQTITTNNVYISKRFRQAIVLHILKNLLRHAEVQVPLLLGIHGPSGEGKTFQCEYILKNMGVKRFLISGGQLDNNISGQAAHFVRNTYIRASESIRSGECSLAVMLVNDVDTGLGSWGDSAISGQSTFTSMRSTSPAGGWEACTSACSAHRRKALTPARLAGETASMA